MTALIPIILFEDPNVLVISKPAGLLSQGEETGAANLIDWAREYLGRHYVGLVHRLDRNTSGAMVLAKRTKAAERLTNSLQKGDLKREYLAWCVGNLKSEVHWKHWLVKDEAKNTTKAYKQARPDAKEAGLFAKPEAHGTKASTEWTRVRVRLETGRSHQIRAQFAAEGHPLLGDAKYGGPGLVPRTALHSQMIEFPHPISKEILRFEAPLPADLKL